MQPSQLGFIMSYGAVVAVLVNTFVVGWVTTTPTRALARASRTVCAEWSLLLWGTQAP